MFFNCAIAQSQDDTLNGLQAKASLYLSQLYQDKMFDTVYKQWNLITFSEAEEIYKKRKKVFKTRQELINELRKDFNGFYKSSKNFKLLSFDNRTLSHEGGNLNAYFEYSYQEDVDGKSSRASSLIYFIYNKRHAKWQVVDFRVPTLLGSPQAWMK